MNYFLRPFSSKFKSAQGRTQFSCSINCMLFTWNSRIDIKCHRYFCPEVFDFYNIVFAGMAISRNYTS